MVDKDLSDLFPAFRPLAQAFFAKLKDAGLDAFPTETWRDPDREDQLHAQGVTPATGATCKHCFELDGQPASKALDFLLRAADGSIIANGADSAYHIAGTIAEALGLVWGGRFTHPDFDHIEYKD
jgi:hypothetical protein